MRNPERLLDTSLSDQTVCLSLSIGLHLLMVLWNPTIMRGNWQPPHNPLVDIDIVEEAGGAPPGGSSVEPPKKTSFMDALKDMLMKPKVEQIAHVSPEPPTARVAAPLLKEKTMPVPMAMKFQPRSSAQDLASAASAGQIDIKSPNAPVTPSGPTLTAKSFGGIRTKDLPFQLGTDQSIAGGAGPVVPIAVGNRKSSDALGYASPSLSNKEGGPRGIRPTLGSGTAALNTIGAGGPQTIALSGTGGTGNAPTGAPSGSVLRDREGSGFGRGGTGGGHGSGTGWGGAGSGIGGIPSAAADLDRQLSANAANRGRTAAKPKSVELEGPIGSRTIIKKVIPQYPAWAEEQGIIGSVRIYFTVAADGSVRSNLRVTKTTGYPQLDQLGIDALKQWRFAPAPTGTDEGSQWGIITFNFSLS